MKQIFKNTRRLVLFLLVSGLMVIFYTPHLRFNMKLNNTTDGTVIVSNFNTIRGEEIFTNYNYNSHKSWIDVHPGWKEVNIPWIPMVTNSIRVEFDNITDISADQISVTFGPFELKKYDAQTISADITSSSGIVWTWEENHINIHVDNVRGWFQLGDVEYFPRWGWLALYGCLLAFAWFIAYMIDKHIDFIEHIPQNEMALIGIPCWMFFICECILGNFYYIDVGHRILNVGLLLVVYKLFYLLFRRAPGSVLLTNIGLTVFSIVSVFVVQFRSRPIAPWDFSALGTALDVAGKYDWTFPYYMVIGIVMCFVFWLIMRAVPKSKIRLNKYYLAYPIIILVVSLFFNSVGSYYLWDMNLLSTYQTDGTMLTFTGLFRQYLEDQPKAPDNYSKQELEDLKEKYAAEAAASTGTGIVPDTIIQVMNESFSNLDVGGTEYAKDMTPFYNNLDNTIRGNLYVSVRGGGTCNTEYETLTGNTTAFFSTGVYPYNMYMHRNVPSLVSYFNNEGWTTTGIHLGKATNWNRQSAYKKLQFQNTEFADTFDGLETLHGYPSDKEDFKHVIAAYEANKDKRNYIFNVTYQNHGGYDDTADLTKTVDLSGAGQGDYTHAENYLSLIKVTDQDFEELINYFKGQDKHVMIIMYGDHQPSLGADCDNLFFPHAGDSKEAFMTEHITPFLIWANYDLPDAYYEKMSTNYMSSLILKTANLQMTPYQQFLFDLKDEYPVIGPYGCFDKNGNFYESVYDIKDPLIDQYRALQYNNVFDKNRDEDLFYNKDVSEETSQAGELQPAQ